MTWESWSAGETRCPLCEGLDASDFEAICDCSRWSVEHGHGQPGIRVIGHPDVTPIGPTPSAAELERHQPKET